MEAASFILFYNGNTNIVITLQSCKGVKPAVCHSLVLFLHLTMNLISSFNYPGFLDSYLWKVSYIYIYIYLLTYINIYIQKI